MNSTISTFLKIAITVLSISAFLFYIGYNMIGSQTTTYSSKITGVSSNTPSGSGSATNTSP